MIKNKIIILFALLFALSASTCKKKYPKDIPKWLKEKIEQMEKEYKREGWFSGQKYCRSDVPREVKEYSDGSSTFYWIGAGNMFGWTIYNYSGQEVCKIGSYSSNPCGNYGYSKNFIRKIWEENCR